MLLCGFFSPSNPYGCCCNFQYSVMHNVKYICAVFFYYFNQMLCISLVRVSVLDFLAAHQRKTYFDAKLLTLRLKITPIALVPSSLSFSIFCLKTIILTLTFLYSLFISICRFVMRLHGGGNLRSVSI